MYSRCPLSLFLFFSLPSKRRNNNKGGFGSKTRVVKSLRINDSVKTVAKVVKNTTEGRDRSLFNKNCFCSLFFRFFFQKVDDFHHGIPMMTDDCTRLEYA